MGWPLLAVISAIAISAIAAGITSVFPKARLEDVPSHLGNAVRTGIVLALLASAESADGPFEWLTLECQLLASGV